MVITTFLITFCLIKTEVIGCLFLQSENHISSSSYFNSRCVICVTEYKKSEGKEETEV